MQKVYTTLTNKYSLNAFYLSHGIILGAVTLGRIVG